MAQDSNDKEILIQQERSLFIEMCVGIASKNFDIKPEDLVKYVSTVCNGFTERYSK